MDKLNIVEFAEKQVITLTNDIKEYVNDGWDIKKAIAYVRSTSCLSDKYFTKILENLGIEAS